MAQIVVKEVEMPVEEIAWKYLLEVLGNDKAKANSQLSGFAEQIYTLNRGLAAKGPLIPVGTIITMPPLNTNRRAKPNRLWG